MSPRTEDASVRRVPVHRARTRALPHPEPPMRVAWADIKPGTPDETKLLLEDAPLCELPIKKLQKDNLKSEKTNSVDKKNRLYNILRPPYFIICLIIIFVCMDLWANEDVRAALEYAPGRERRRELWRLLTYSCLHAGPQHLALNSLVSLAVGWTLEREQGGWRLAALWGGGAVAGALGASTFQPAVRVIGASAGVYTLLTSHLANVILGYGKIKLWWFRVLAVCVLSASDCAWLLVRSAGAQAQVAQEAHAHLAQYHAAPPPPPPVAWSAHAAGAAVGLPLALLLFTGVNEKKPAVLVARWLSATLLVFAAAAAILSNVYLHPDTER